MIRLILRPGEEPRCSGLIPGQQLHVTLPDGREWLIHRHGPLCTAHLLDYSDDREGKNE